MKFCSLFSGSSGNSLFVSQHHTKILIDAGLSGIRIQNALSDIDERPDEINAIVVTHEHDDHIRGVGVLSRRFDVPIYANEKTWKAMRKMLGKVKDCNMRIVDFKQTFDIEDLEIQAFRTSHDAADPAGFVINDGKKRLGVATDSGIVTAEMRSALSGCELVVLESNHDVSMLEVGPYPFYLKQRIKGEFGHLSNETAADLALHLVQEGTEHLILAHLSQENNYPLLAYETTARILSQAGARLNTDVKLCVAKRGCVSETIIF